MRASSHAGGIVVTGLGATSALGAGVGAILRAMVEGRDGIHEMTRFDVSALHPVRYAGWLHEAWARGEPASLDAWARLAAREAWDDAGLAGAGVAPERIAVVSGTTLGEEGALARSADAVAEEIGARGPRWTITTACASSANAIGLARDLVSHGDADVAIAGGAEKLVIQIMAGFAALGVLGAHKCAPFGDEIGTTLGEGAGFVVLERAGARGVRVRAHLLGYGLSGDAWHETTPDPRGEGTARAIAGCLADAGVRAADVDYVNAHATGTAANDDAEWRGIQKALGPRARAIPVSASKGYLGHAQGAAGVLETIATIACMERGLVPPSARVGRGRPHGPADTVGETGRAREGAIDVALSNSAAFGGANAVVAVGRSARAMPGSAARTVTIDGIAALRTARGVARDEAAIARACGDVDLRTTDPSSRYVIACTASACAVRRAIAPGCSAAVAGRREPASRSSAGASSAGWTARARQPSRGRSRTRPSARRPSRSARGALPPPWSATGSRACWRSPTRRAGCAIATTPIGSWRAASTSGRTTETRRRAPRSRSCARAGVGRASWACPRRALTTRPWPVRSSRPGSSVPRSRRGARHGSRRRRAAPRSWCSTPCARSAKVRASRWRARPARRVRSPSSSRP